MPARRTFMSLPSDTTGFAVLTAASSASIAATAWLYRRMMAFQAKQRRIRKAEIFTAATVAAIVASALSGYFGIKTSELAHPSSSSSSNPVPEVVASMAMPSSSSDPSFLDLAVSLLQAGDSKEDTRGQCEKRADLLAKLRIGYNAAVLIAAVYMLNRIND